MNTEMIKNPELFEQAQEVFLILFYQRYAFTLTLYKKNLKGCKLKYSKEQKESLKKAPFKIKPSPETDPLFYLKEFLKNMKKRLPPAELRELILAKGKAYTQTNPNKNDSFSIITRAVFHDSKLLNLLFEMREDNSDILMRLLSAHESTQKTFINGIEYQREDTDKELLLKEYSDCREIIKNRIKKEKIGDDAREDLLFSALTSKYYFRHIYKNDREELGTRMRQQAEEEQETAEWFEKITDVLKKHPEFVNYAGACPLRYIQSQCGLDDHQIDEFIGLIRRNHANVLPREITLTPLMLAILSCSPALLELIQEYHPEAISTLPGVTLSDLAQLTDNDAIISLVNEYNLQDASVDHWINEAAIEQFIGQPIDEEKFDYTYPAFREKYHILSFQGFTPNTANHLLQDMMGDFASGIHNRVVPRLIPENKKDILPYLDVTLFWSVYPFGVMEDSGFSSFLQLYELIRKNARNQRVIDAVQMFYACVYIAIYRDVPIKVSELEALTNIFCQMIAELKGTKNALKIAENALSPFIENLFQYFGYLSAPVTVQLMENHINAVLIEYKREGDDATRQQEDRKKFLDLSYDIEFFLGNITRTQGYRDISAWSDNDIDDLNQFLECVLGASEIRIRCAEDEGELDFLEEDEEKLQSSLLKISSDDALRFYQYKNSYVNFCNNTRIAKNILESVTAHTFETVFERIGHDLTVTFHSGSYSLNETERWNVNQLLKTEGLLGELTADGSGSRFTWDEPGTKIKKKTPEPSCFSTAFPLLAPPRAYSPERVRHRQVMEEKAERPRNPKPAQVKNDVVDHVDTTRIEFYLLLEDKKTVAVFRYPAWTASERARAKELATDEQPLKLVDLTRAGARWGNVPNFKGISPDVLNNLNDDDAIALERSLMVGRIGNHVRALKVVTPEEKKSMGGTYEEETVVKVKFYGSKHKQRHPVDEVPKSMCRKPDRCAVLLSRGLANKDDTVRYFGNVIQPSKVLLKLVTHIQSEVGVTSIIPPVRLRR